MLPLLDMMLRAQNGAAMDAMAKQFNLAQEQAAQAMAALMPAFSSGLKRTSDNPYDFTSLMSTMFSGAYAKYFEDLGKAFTPQGVADGNAVLEKLFGSKEVSRAIAAQAEQLTGITQDILKKMMPAMADTLMGGLFKQATGQMQNGSNPFAGTPMAQMMQPWLASLGLHPKPKAPDAFDNPFLDAARQFWGAGQTQQGKTGNGNPFMDNPFAKAFQDMMAGNFPPAGAGTSKESPAPDLASFRQALNSMFDSGIEVQKNYQKNMEAIFDTYLRGASPTSSDTTPKK
jgi:hypothetical protein